MRLLIAANWKMHGDMSWADKPTKLDAILPADQRTGIDILICPPFPILGAIKKAAAPAKILVGAQDCHAEIKGAHTGDISAEMIASTDSTYVIVGHSERRALGESDSDVKAKAHAALRAGLTPIICVGETLTQREAGQAEGVVKSMIEQSMPDGEGDIVIAYEPVWAIGTGKTAKTKDIAEMHAAIRDQVGPKVRILYGGSVKPQNTEAIFSVPHVNGALIGGAGLEMESLAAIAKFAVNITA